MDGSHKIHASTPVKSAMELVKYMCVFYSFHPYKPPPNSYSVMAAKTKVRSFFAKRRPTITFVCTQTHKVLTAAPWIDRADGRSEKPVGHELPPPR